MKNRLFQLFIIPVLIFSGCKGDAPEVPVTPPEEIAEIAILSAMGVYSDYATLTGHYTAIEGKSIVERGFIISTEKVIQAFPDPDDPDDPRMRYISDGVSQGEYNQKVEELNAGTFYYYKAYVIRTTGEVIWSAREEFRTLDMPLEPASAPAGTVEINANAYTFQAVITVPNLGVDQLSEYEKHFVKVANLGIRIKLDDAETENSYLTIDYTGNEADANLLRTGDVVKLDIPSLPLFSSTTYSYTLFVKVGVYDQPDGNHYLEPVCNEPSNFTTPGMPSVTSVSATDVAATTATFNGSVDMNSGPAGLTLVSVGVKYGTDASLLDKDKSVPWTTNGAFSLALDDLNAGLTYCFRAYVIVENALGEQITVLAHASVSGTTEWARPVATISPMDHAYRTSGFNTTTSSAIIPAKITNVGTSNPSGWGIYWGADPDNLTKVVVAEGAAASTLSADGSFHVPLTELSPATTYYVKAYATSADFPGENISDVATFSIAVADRGLPYQYTEGGSYPNGTKSYERCNRAISGTPNIYYECDPVTGNDGTVYHFLDRNLGSVEYFTSNNCYLGLYQTAYAAAATNTNHGQYQRMGDLYQWGWEKPALVYYTGIFGGNAVSNDNNGFVCTTPIGPLTYRVFNDPAAVGVAKTVTDVALDQAIWSPAEWPSANNPCPPGYVIPNNADFQNIINSMSGKTLRGSGGWHEKLLLGTSPARNGTGNAGYGVPVNQGDNGAPGVCFINLWSRSNNDTSGAAGKCGFQICRTPKDTTYDPFSEFYEDVNITELPAIVRVNLDYRHGSAIRCRRALEGETWGQ